MYAILSAGWVLPSLVAPFFAGFVTEHLSWRWVFLGIIPLAAARRRARESTDGRVRPGRRRSRPRQDARGDDRRRLLAAALTAGGVGVVALGLRASNVVAALVITAAGLSAAVPGLRRLMPAGFFSARCGLPAVLLCRVLATAAFLGVDSFVPLAADRIHGATAVVQGFVIIGAALTWTLGQAIMARRTTVDTRRAVAAGFGLLGLGTVLVVPVLWSSWPLWATFLSWPVGGLGMGILFNPTSVAAMSAATPGHEGAVSSQVNLSDALGFSVMGALGGAIVALADRTALSIRGALGIEFGLAVGCAALGAVAARRITVPVRTSIPADARRTSAPRS